MAIILSSTVVLVAKSCWFALLIKAAMGYTRKSFSGLEAKRYGVPFAPSRNPQAHNHPSRVDPRRGLQQPRFLKVTVHESIEIPLAGSEFRSFCKMCGCIFLALSDIHGDRHVSSLSNVDCGRRLLATTRSFTDHLPL